MAMIVIFITGYACTGKSTLAKLICEKEQIGYISFHDEMSIHAKEKGFSKTRFLLKELGTKEFLATATTIIANKALENNTKHLIIDGLYNWEMFLKIEKLTHFKPHVIGIESDRNIRVERMMTRMSDTLFNAERQIKLYDDFKDDFGIAEVMSKNDYRFANNSSLKDAILTFQQIINTIRYGQQ